MKINLDDIDLMNVCEALTYITDNIARTHEGLALPQRVEVMKSHRATFEKVQRQRLKAMQRSS